VSDLPGPPAGPGPSSPEEPKDTLVPSEDLSTESQWDAVPEALGSLSPVDLEGSSVQGLVQQFEALPGDLMGLPPDSAPCPLHMATGQGLDPHNTTDAHGLLSAEAGRDDLLSLLQGEGHSPSKPGPQEPPEPAHPLLQPPSWCREDADEESEPPEWAEGASAEQDGSRSSSSSPEPWLETSPLVTPEEPPAGVQVVSREALGSLDQSLDVPGPCDHEDLMDGVIFGAKYLGSTQLVSERNPPPSTRMAQAQEAMDRVKVRPGREPTAPWEQGLASPEPRLGTAIFPRAPPLPGSPEPTASSRSWAPTSRPRRALQPAWDSWHLLQAQLIARAIGQAFTVAYSQFLRESGIDPSQVGTQPSQGAASPGHLHNGDLDHFSNSENCREVCIEKRRGEGLGVALVESGWGSLLPTAVIANLLHGGPAERSGALSIGPGQGRCQGPLLHVCVGPTLAVCAALAVRLIVAVGTAVTAEVCGAAGQAAVRQVQVVLRGAVQLQGAGIWTPKCRSGRHKAPPALSQVGPGWGHRIIEINGQSVVATRHERIIELLTEAHRSSGTPPPPTRISLSQSAFWRPPWNFRTEGLKFQPFHLFTV
uniref:Amyloid beta precursor protein binding family A member 3 n=1 Tax=Spermophilus dauricus TaxID=99837 RepID=A0A8C9PI44_SPEDA